MGFPGGPPDKVQDDPRGGCMAHIRWKDQYSIGYKDIDTQQVVDLRRMLLGAGYGPIVEELEAKGTED